MDLELQELRREFLAEADAKVREMREVAGGGFPPERSGIERMIYLAHQLKGAGGSYGFEVISIESEAIEDELEGALEGRRDDELGRRVTNHLEKLASVIRQRTEELTVRA